MTSGDTRFRQPLPPASRPRPGSIRLIVLAAGASSRLGSPKQLLQLQGETLLARTLRVASALTVAREQVALPLLVITGAHHARVVRELAGFEHAVAVRNKRWREGMASSLRLGIAQARAQTDCIAAMILLCDQPLIGCAQLQAVVDAFLADPERIAASRYDDRLGVPAVFGREHFGELLRLTGDEGARRLLRGGRNVTVVEIPEAAIDIDTPADVQRWQSDPSPPADGRDGDDPG